jgi:glycerophosphoryl diester phosphodiesterase
LESTQLDACSVHEESRLGDHFQGTPIPTLKQVVELIQQWPEAKAFVEIKRKSLRHFGMQKVVDQIMTVLSPYLQQCIVISFDADAVRYARDQGALSIGWVFKKWTEEIHQIAEELQPEFLFTEHTAVAKESRALWPGRWQWVLYDVMDTAQALAWAADGIHMIETGAIGEMLQHPLLQKESCAQK